MRPETTRRFALVAALAIAVAAVTRFTLRHAGSLYDDAYIYFRYVVNAQHGCGLRYNCADPPVEGFSSPAYLALLVAAHRLGLGLEAAATLLCSLAVALAIVLAAAVALRATRRPSAALAVALALGLDHSLLLNGVTGMETALAAAAIALLGWTALGDGRASVPAALFAGLCRPEALVLAVALPLDRRVRRARFLGALALGLAAIAGARLALFGDLLPNTYWAKAGGTAAHAVLGLAYLGEVFAQFPLLAFAPLALLDADVRGKAAPLLAGGAVWLLSFLRTGGDHFAYARLAAPLVPLGTALAAIGLEAALGRVARRVAGPAAAALLVAAGLRAYTAHALAPQHGFDNVLAWRRVAEWIRARHPGESVATVPIGAIGYFSGAPRVIDLVGLTSRPIAHGGGAIPGGRLTRSWLGHERHDTEWVLAQAPSLIVFSKARATPWTLEDARAGFWADWLLLEQVKAGRAPYVVEDAEIAPGVHWLVLRRAP